MSKKKNKSRSFRKRLLIVASIFTSLACFSLVLVKYGYQQPSINKISDVAGLSSGSLYKKLSDSSSEWSFETSGSVEKITTSTEGWVCQAGGDNSVTHYSRIKYKIPEKTGLTPTTFYMKAKISLPADFYTKQKAGFRIMNTDNFGTQLGGNRVGAKDADELRASIHIYRDHLWRIIATHENHPNKEIWVSKTPIPVGEHTLEFYGDVANVSPWYFKVDGITLASGTDRLSPETVSPSERVITRLNVGIDGAADQDLNSMSVIVKDFEIASYDPTINRPSATITPSTSPKASPKSSPESQNTKDNKGPIISVSSPSYNQKVENSVKISATATDPSGVSYMEIWFDNKLIKKCSTATCSTTKNTVFSSRGSHKIKIVAVDNSASHNRGASNIVIKK